ncbi:MAG: M23 family metallopeptidase [Gemmatimonadaceae bacterium]|nr:M23 family metallopeptidase [Gemmatimonadaceae bacterium]
MKLFSFRVRFVVVLVAVIALGRSLSAQGATFPPFLELRVPKPPSVGTGDAGSFLAYELHVTNMTAQSTTLKKVEVTTDDGARHVLLALSDSSLARVISRPGVTMAIAEQPKLGGGLRAIVFLWVPVDGPPPSHIRHRITVEQGSGDSARVQELDGPAVPVSGRAVVIGPPLRGGPWLAANGPGNTSGHRRALIPIGGSPAIAQRFAIDYVKVGDDGRTFTGDRLKNESFYAEGQDALAVADGIVVALKDGIPENVPGITSRAVPITLETVGGNHVILDIGDGRYAFYAHIKPGTLRVRQGERVRRGQVVGLVGNSGNSTEPHLHFHISDANSPLGSEGIPYTHDAVELVGRCRVIGAACERTTPAVRRGEMPMQNALVRFPQ